MMLCIRELCLPYFPGITEFVKLCLSQKGQNKERSSKNRRVERLSALECNSTGSHRHPNRCRNAGPDTAGAPAGKRTFFYIAHNRTVIIWPASASIIFYASSDGSADSRRQLQHRQSPRPQTLETWLALRHRGHTWEQTNPSSKCVTMNSRVDQFEQMSRHE